MKEALLNEAIDIALNEFFDDEWEGTVSESDRIALARKLRLAFANIDIEI